MLICADLKQKINEFVVKHLK